MTTESESRLEIRELVMEDYEAVKHLQEVCFPQIVPWTEEDFRSQVTIFPEGQIGIELDGKLVAASASLIVTGEDWDGEHTYDEVSAGDSIRNHEPDGDTLYGIDIVVDPQCRGMRLARRIYEQRKLLVRRRNLRRIMIAGRLPGLINHPDLRPDEYLRCVLDKEIIDTTLQPQIANGFVISKILHDYLPEDTNSRGCAVLMKWLNPEWVPAEDLSVRSRARVGAVQYRMRPVKSFEDFERQCRFFVETASEYRCDFVLYPELLTNQLLSLVTEARPGLSVRRLDEFTDRYIEMFSGLALRYNINIIGGTHLVVEDDVLYNVAYLFHRDGRIDRQYKLHITPPESKWWGVSAGDKVQVFDTDCGKIAVLICYDVEFPELARIAKAKGANILFVPYNTNLRSGHIRVRTCAHARCIENNVYVVLSGACGNLPAVDNADIHYARSAILTPSDIPFARDGVGAEANDNVETLVVHELDFSLLRRMQRQGAVRTWTDRRHDLYQLTWQEDDDSFTVR